MRDPGVIDALDPVEGHTRAFDAISRESDPHYSARSFVTMARMLGEAKPRTPNR